MLDEWTAIAPTPERKMDVDGPGNPEGRIYQVNVAPIISDEKVSFVVRQMASTLSGGLRLLPGMTWKAHLMQFFLWILPPALGFVVSVVLSSQSAVLRFFIAGAIAALWVAMVDLFRWHICRRGESESARQNMWFTDYDDVDYSNLLSPATCRAMLPPKRSSLHVVLCWLFSFLLMGTAAGVLNFRSIEADLGQGFGSWLAVLLSLKCFLTVATAQFGLTTFPAPEPTSHRYCDPLTLPGLLEDYSRPLLVLALLGPALLELGAAGAWLRVSAALLPVLWATGVMPQLDTLLSWALDQLEVHVFGGSPVPRDVRLLGAIFASVTATAGIALISEATKEQNEELAAIMVLIIGLLFAGLLALLPPRLMDFGYPFIRWLGAAELQVAVSAASSIILLLGLGLDDIRASLAADREMSAPWLIRLLLEQVAALLTFGGLYLSTCRLRAGGCWGDLRLGTGASKPASTSKPDGQSVGITTRRLFAACEVLVRVLLLAHAACYGVVALVVADAGVLAFDAAVLLRAWRIVLANPMRAAGDAWLAGILDAVLAAAGVEGGIICWSLGVRLLVVSLVRQRLIALLKRMQYAAHLCRVTSKIPKLRHWTTGKVLMANALFFPFLLLVLLLSAVLESPLVALFTLPCFAVGYPRPRHGHPELSPEDTPMSKGVEGLFYSILAPSLLRDLIPRWRYGALSTQPGMLFFCRSHERLACLVRVLGAGFGWVQVEFRGLEMQEPTSCHHVEAGIIDDAFSLAFKGEALPPSRRQAGQNGPGSASGGGGETAAGPLPDLFVLRPVCQVRATTYEQTQLSMTGIIDSHDTLRQVHRLFLKTLLWVMAQHRANGGLIPRAWLSCPVKVRDAQTVLNLLRTSKWPERVATAFNTQDLLANADSATMVVNAGAIAAQPKEISEGRESSKGTSPPSRTQSSGPSPALRPETPTNGAWNELGRQTSPPWQDLATNTGSFPASGQPAAHPNKETAKAPEPVARVPSPPLAPAPAPVAAVAPCRGRGSCRTDSDPLKSKTEGLAATEPAKDMDLAPLTGRLPELLRSRSGGGDNLSPLNLPPSRAPTGMGMPEADSWPPLEQAGQPLSPPAKRNPLAHPLAPMERAPVPDMGSSMFDLRSGSGCGLDGGIGNHAKTTQSNAWGGARQGVHQIGGSPSPGSRNCTSFGGTGIRLYMDGNEAPPTHAPSSTLPPCKPPVRTGYSPRVVSEGPCSPASRAAPEPSADRPQTHPLRSPPDSARAQDKHEDDLDKLMDMVLDFGPGQKQDERTPKSESSSKSPKRSNHYKTPQDGDRSCSPVPSDNDHWDQDIMNPMPMKQRELMHQASPSPELEDVCEQEHSYVPQPPSRSPPPASEGPLAGQSVSQRDSQERRPSGPGLPRATTPSRESQDRRPGSGLARPGSGLAREGLPGSGLAREGRPGSGLTREGRPGSGLTRDGRPGSGLTREGRPSSGLARPSSGLARTPTPPGISPPMEYSAVRGDVSPAGAGAPAQRNKTPPPAEPFRPPSTQPACLDELDYVTALTIQAYTAIDIAPAYGQSPEALGPNHVFKAYTGKITQGCQISEVEWLFERPELQELTVRAFRYALKITVDCIAMAEDAAAMDDEELESELRELDEHWHLGDDCTQAWQAAMEERRPHLMALRRPQGTSSGYQVLRLNLREDDVGVAELRPEVVQSIWASQSIELRYFTNDDDERYSIQAHPTLLRNMIVQSAEYPIFVSPPTTIWL